MGSRTERQHEGIVGLLLEELWASWPARLVAHRRGWKKSLDIILMSRTS